MVAELLNAGKENARTGRELAAILGVDIRNITAAINRERNHGKPICAASSAEGQMGYYLASTKQEMEDYCGRLHHREREMAKVRRACTKAGSSLPDAEGAETDQEPAADVNSTTEAQA